MASITIRNIPESILAKVRALSKIKKRSMNNELLLLIEKGLIEEFYRKSDGGMVANDLLMQFQADILDIPVVRPKVAEITAKGAAYAAGLASGFWRSLDEIAFHWSEGKRWIPQLDADERKRKLRFWQKAVERSLDWVE